MGDGRRGGGRRLVGRGGEVRGPDHEQRDELERRHGAHDERGAAPGGGAGESLGLGVPPSRSRPMKIATTPASPCGSWRGPYTLPSRSTTWLVSCSRFHVARYSSPQSFDVPYGASGRRGASSATGPSHSP